MKNTLLIACLLSLSVPALAYVGPGAGISVLGSLLGILATIVIAIGAIVMWPLRKALKRRRRNAEASEAAAAGGERGAPADRA